jgi:ABC-type multidrug transport system fused ATPase/permease subunit
MHACLTPRPALPPYRHRDFLHFLVCAPFFWMLLFLMAEAALAASTTWLIIEAGRDVVDKVFLVSDFLWIVGVQSASYVVGASSWIFAERAGFGAFGRYMLRFARDNRHQASLLGHKDQRDEVEPFLTNEAFHIFFELVYELEADLKLLFGLLFNAAVLGVAIDGGLPLVYAGVFATLLLMQWLLRKPVAAAYLAHQRSTNRMTAHTYSAWDNIFSGNRYNFRLWHGGFKTRLRDALAAQIRAILAREGLATINGIVSLAALFAYLAWVAGDNAGNTSLLVALAATLPRQIALSTDMHDLASGWNDLAAVWTRISGACNAMRPAPDATFMHRIGYDQLQLQWHEGDALHCSTLKDVLQTVMSRPTGRLMVRGGNGSGKSTLLAALKTALGQQAFYWPTQDKLAFAFAQGPESADEQDGEDADAEEEASEASSGYSSGERQLRALQEITDKTQTPFYLLDEWDANLDARNRAAAESLVHMLATRAVVVEISHRA